MIEVLLCTAIENLLQVHIRTSFTSFNTSTTVREFAEYIGVTIGTISKHLRNAGMNFLKIIYIFTILLFLGGVSGFHEAYPLFFISFYDRKLRICSVWY